MIKPNISSKIAKDKRKRLEIICEIINGDEEEDYDSQRVLRKKVNEELTKKGYKTVSVATINSDLQELGIDKKNEEEIYQFTEKTKKDYYIRMIEENLQNHKNNHCKEPVVYTIKVDRGYAELISEYLKKAFSKEIIGIIRGDELLTIYCEEECKEVEKILE